MPWATVSTVFGSIDKAGTEGDGILTLIMGGVVIAAAVMSRVRVRRRWVIASLVLAVLCLGVAVYDMVDVESTFAEEDIATGSIGIGLWITAAGAVTAGVGAVQLLRKRP